LRNVEELARYDARFAEPAQQLASARATISDIAASLRDYAEGINASPERLAEIEDRLALLDRLKRKYGKTVAEVIAFGEDVARKLAEVEDRDEILKTLRADLEKPPPPTAKPPPPSPPSARPPQPNSPNSPRRRSTRSP
jgi:DNA repair protein RecN (Recombination protein N)